VKRPGKIICVGRNYREHAREMGNEVPAQPLILMKPPSSVIGDGEAIVIPRASSRVEHEGEIGVVLGRSLRRGDERAARHAVAGVVAMNDVTARDLQKTDGQWTRAKGYDTFCPIAADVVPVSDLQALRVITRVNGAERQRGRAADMAFPIPMLLAWISAVMTLEPGDLVATGTPAGVGPLVPGDVVEVEIEGLSRVSNPVTMEG
jgi:2-keto-4-pentenoate hydratase/2-oxohepta-3-ene-1,7-dioic acid hydratase in catechol pathway